jgi:hypothetical protein
MATKKCSKNIPTFVCEICDYNCSKQSIFNKHLSTNKHKNATKGNIQAAPLTCEFCNKEYKNRTGLWRHKQKCKGNVKNEPSSQDTSEMPDVSKMITPELVMTLLTQNQEFKQLIVEQQKTMMEQQQENRKQQNIIIEQQAENHKIQNQLLEVVKEGKTIINTTTNSNNKFNLNFFLNEQCKDAMNIADFVNNMVLTVEDLKKTGELGYIDGITKIFTDKLRELDMYNRPMHCTDLKRETLYIKNSNEWAKDTEDKDKIKRAIECVANKNLNNLDTWKEENPGHEVMDSKEDKELVKIMTNSLGGMGSDREKNKQKIIKNVLKEIIVEK